MKAPSGDHRQRRSIRLPGFDYTSAGAYFVTMCTNGRECLFGDVLDGEMRLSPAGTIVRDEWLRSEAIREEITLHEFVVMPNHVHGIVIFHDAVGAHGRAPLQRDAASRKSSSLPFLRRPPRSLGSFIAGFKSSATKRVNQLRGSPGVPVWQRNYYEHVIRDEPELYRISEYISFNPSRWANDRENPNATTPDPPEVWEE